MQKKKGISLIVLVITIIVMIILAATIILSLNNTGIIGNANKAVDLTNLANVREFAQTKWAEAYLGTDKTQEKLEKYVMDELIASGIKTEDYEIVVTEKGVTVNKKGEAKIILFHMNGLDHEAEQGMTWEQWIKSKYNKDSYKIVDNMIYSYDGQENIRYTLLDGSTEYVKKEMVINEGEWYIQLDRGISNSDAET